MALSVSVLTEFDSLSRSTETSYYGQFALSMRKESPYNFYIIMHAKFIKKNVSFSFYSSPFTLFVPNSSQ